MIKLINDDCINALSDIDAESIDLTVTSPPYNIGKEYETILPLDEYIQWCVSWINEVYRVTKPNGSFWLNLGYLEVKDVAKALPITYLLFDKIPFYIMQEIVWNYGAGVAAKKYFSPRNEKFLWCVKNKDNYIFNLDAIRDPNVKYPNQKKNGRLRCNPLGKNPTNVWQFPKVTSGKNRSSKERTAHPAQFPIQVIDRIIKASSNKGDLVLDNFMGSGTVGIVCQDLERDFYGIEIKKRYFDIAKERLEIFGENRCGYIE